VIVSRAPFRVSLFGGGTDYRAYAREHGGLVVAAAIDKYSYVTCRPRSALSERRLRLVYSREEVVDAAADLAHPPTRACLTFLDIGDSLEIHCDADLPARTGLGSSSSFTVALLNALHRLRGRQAGPLQLAREAVHIERERLGEAGGEQDQVTAAFGGFNRVTFSGEDGIAVRPLAVPRDRRDALFAHLLLVFTGFARSASEAAEDQARALPGHHAELQALKQCAEEACRVLEGDRPLGEVGRLLHESWTLKKRLSPRISNGRVDAWYEQARALGASGGKLLGAGGGGFMLFFAPPDAHARLVERLGLIHVPFRVDDAGAAILLDAAPAEPAR
jgi:D-glycero-alpha-D-manno-heptose-7-phosphate kinase